MKFVLVLLIGLMGSTHADTLSKLKSKMETIIEKMANSILE